MSDIKYYSNPARKEIANEKHQPYTPQYQEKGIEPFVHSAVALPAGHYALNLKATPLTDNPRLPRPVMRQPYAEAVSSPVGVGRGVLPNIGNNVEQVWTSTGKEIIDDLSNVDPDKLIDNNDFVSSAVFNFTEQQKQAYGQKLLLVDENDLPPEAFEPPDAKPFLTQQDLQSVIDEEHLSKVIKSIDEEEYLLLVDGAAICSGSLDLVQEQTRELVFGKHPLCSGNPVSIEDIVVVKRVKIKIGVFLS
jgi:hypothetical protein